LRRCSPASLARSNITNQTYNASVTSPSTNRVDSMIAKIDHNFNAANQITGPVLLRR